MIAVIAIVLVWGIGMIVRPAATLFLTLLVVIVMYSAVYQFTHPHDRTRTSTTWSN